MTISRDKFQQITNSRYGIELQHTSGGLRIRPVSSSERVEIESDVYPDFDMTPNQLRSFLNSIGQECDWNERISIEFLQKLKCVEIINIEDSSIEQVFKYKVYFNLLPNRSFKCYATSNTVFFIQDNFILTFEYIRDLVLFFQSQRIDLEF